jgi:hypothetical protein
MKQIFLIETVSEKLNMVKQFISLINAEYKLFGSVNEALRARSTPDLVVLFSRSPFAHFLSDIDALNKSIFALNVPRMYVISPEMEEQMPKESAVAQYPLVMLPVEKIEFLSTAAGLMNIPFRRKFRIIISIEEKGNIKHSGLSIDFSESGMAFESTDRFKVEANVKVNFVNPKNRNRLSLRGDIVRTFPARSDTTVCYGVRFTGMSAKNKEELLSFVMGKS